MTRRTLVLAAFVGAFMFTALPGLRAQAPETTIRAIELLSPLPDKRTEAIEWFEKRGNKDAIPALIQTLRFTTTDRRELADAIEALAGETGPKSWNEWMLWQEKHKEIKPFKGFAAFKAALYAKIDPFFAIFLHDGVAHEIRLEEVTWGGVVKDGIPALTNPKLVPAKEAKYLTPGELVFGVSINGDTRAYPLRILDWHEMFNDVIGGVPVSLAYCTLCGSGILFDTTVEGRDKPFVFGSSGFLYRSNKLMYDTETNSLWNQFTGRPVVGPLTGSDIELKTRPVAITSWSAWLKANPDTKVLSLETGFTRDYSPGAPYGQYFSSDKLMFPALVDETKLKAKDYVFALRNSGTEKAWPLKLFEQNPVINDTAGAVSLTLIGNPKTRTVRAYRTDGQAFKQADNRSKVTLDGKAWKVTEDALIGPDGKRLHRLPGHIAFWFAWSGYLGDEGEVAQATN
ncbi:MAG: DUF3179 domain-containing protein [Hyphomicrobiaceae bacterium]|nr:DUF3179 domain-containing protein [Hyphomicrobiaceae bacterium]